MRLALHRSVLAEIRERFGVSTGSELLSNSFNLTLAVSMPTDLTIAEPDIYRRLKTVVGHLRGAYKDIPLDATNSEFYKFIEWCRIEIQDAVKTHAPTIVKDKDTLSPFDAELAFFEEAFGRMERAFKMLHAPMEVTLRAAAGIIRSFFSAASLVAQMPKHLAGTGGEGSDGALGEFEDHKRRLDELILRVRDAQWANEIVDHEITAIDRRYKELTGSSLWYKKYELVEPYFSTLIWLRIYCRDTPFGNILPKPLHSGELIWLLNERGVIALLQGDLYEAQRSFAEADDAHTVFRGKGQSWRRLEINRTLLRIERGEIHEAYSHLQTLKAEMKDHPLQCPDEDTVTEPLIMSYEGLCENLRGNYVSALKLYKKASKLLITTKQQRALAVNYIRHAQLLLKMGRSIDGLEKATLGLATAEAGRQMDLVWRAQIVKANCLPLSDGLLVEKIYTEALQYATVMDLPRVRVLALRGKAQYLLKLGHLDSAGFLAAEAMKEATRYGMTLHRIALRVLMGKILLRRGDKSGHYLLERAIVLSNRIGYQLQVDNALQAQLDAQKEFAEQVGVL